MAETPTTINFTLTKPDGTTVTGGKVTFTLSGYDLDGGVVMPGAVEATIASDGTGTAALWPNVAGLKNTNYKVSIAPTGGSKVDVGAISVPEAAAGVALHTLIQVGTYAGLKTAVLTQAEYDALTTKDTGTLYLIRAE